MIGPRTLINETANRLFDGRQTVHGLLTDRIVVELKEAGCSAQCIFDMRENHDGDTIRRRLLHLADDLAELVGG